MGKRPGTAADANIPSTRSFLVAKEVSLNLISSPVCTSVAPIINFF